jgi:hypothetical protein
MPLLFIVNLTTIFSIAFIGGGVFMFCQDILHLYNIINNSLLHCLVINTIFSPFFILKSLIVILIKVRVFINMKSIVFLSQYLLIIKFMFIYLIIILEFYILVFILNLFTRILWIFDIFYIINIILRFFALILGEFLIILINVIILTSNTPSFSHNINIIIILELWCLNKFLIDKFNWTLIIINF